MASVARKVLIVDDDPWVGKLVEFVARDLGFEPLLARDGAEALEKYGEELPDVVIADVVLPKIDGLEVCRRIKSTGPGAFTPVLVVSGIYRSEREALRRFRADGFYQKPLSPETLQKRLSTLFPPPFEPPADATLEPAQTGEVGLDFEPLPRALARLFQKKLSGTLHVRVKGAKAQFLLRDGRLTFARSEAWSEGIVAILQRQHRLTAEQKAHLEKLVAQKGDPQAAGELAIREGFVTPEELVRLVSHQFVHRVLEAFRWREGFHRFEESAVPEGNKAALDLDAPSLLHWGLRRGAGGENQVDDFLASRRTPLSRHPEADGVLRTLPLSRAEKWLLERADGTSSFEELLGEVPSSDQAARAAVHRAAIALAALGAISAPARLEQPLETVTLDPVPVAEPALPRPLSGTMARLVLELWQQRVTGTLEIDAPGGPRTLYWRGGQLCFVRHGEGERLDALLVRRGKLRPEAKAQLEMMLRPGRSVPEVLVELQAITPQQLAQFARTELKAALRELTRHENLSTTFVEGPIPSAELPPHEWDAGEAIVDAVRSQDLAFVRTRLPSEIVPLQRARGWDQLATVLPLTTNERNLVNLLAAPQPWSRLAGTGLVSLEDQQRALWVLLAVGLVAPASQEAARPTRGPRTPDPLAGIDPPSLELVEEEDVVLDPESEDAPRRPIDEEEVLLEVSAAAAAGEGLGAPRPARASVPALDAPAARPVSPEPVVAARKHAWGIGGANQPRRKTEQAETVPRELYEQVLAEKRELEQRLYQLLDQQASQDAVPREFFDQVQAEKTELKGQIGQLLDEVLRLKNATSFTAPPTRPAPRAPAPLPPQPDPDEGGVISFKRQRR